MDKWDIDRRIYSELMVARERSFLNVRRQRDRYELADLPCGLRPDHPWYAAHPGAARPTLEIYTSKVNVSNKQVNVVTVNYRYLQGIGVLDRISFNASYSDLLKHTYQELPERLGNRPVAPAKLEHRLQEQGQRLDHLEYRRVECHAISQPLRKHVQLSAHLLRRRPSQGTGKLRRESCTTPA